MSLQGPLVVVAEVPAPDVVEALGAAGAFPIVEANWADAPTAFVSVKPAAVVIAEPGPAPSEAAARMLCLQIATAQGPIVPTVALCDAGSEPALPIALPADISLPRAHLVRRLQSALRVRALHETVLRRLELFVSEGGNSLGLPEHDALEDATVLIAGRGPLYPGLSVAMGERVKMIGALSVETAARHLNARDISGIVVGDGFSPRMVEAFLTVLAQDTRFRDIPVAVIGDVSRTFADVLPNIDHVDGDPARLVARMMPLVRLYAFEERLKRMLKSLEAGGLFDPETGLHAPEAFCQDLAQAIEAAADRSQALSIARFAFEGMPDARAGLDTARLVTKLIRDIDFATRDEDGAILIAFTHTDLRAAHVVVRRIASALKNAMGGAVRDTVITNVTLATLKTGDTIDSLMQRVMGSRMVAAE
ncbi:GGDEF domain-containing protein [Pseudolabrys taiwanensis]|uniref:GGDEF domain-containing protein n=1 Tax=Pseudolabrys taiwanensis TaxID=331696 RepID=A0A345ZSX2_9HYPH|nr:GGDEF domain-containing protein [Pseudolabrys taiwanensis]AXK80019.1 GGDEF domain-containing protein [Pseudolabrys taiwanensis]